MSDKEKWQRLVARNLQPLHVSTQWEYLKHPVDHFGITWGKNFALVIKYETTLSYMFYPEAPVTESNLGEFLGEINDNVNQFLDMAEEEVDKDLELQPALKREDLAHFVHRLGRELNLMVMGLNVAPIVRDQIEKTIGKEAMEQIDHYISQPHRPSFAIAEWQGILEAAKKDDFESDAQALADKYGYFHMEYRGRVWTRDDFVREINAAKGRNVEEENEPDLSSFSEYERWLIDVLRRFVYVYDEGKTAIVRAAYCIHETLKNLGYSENEAHKLCQMFYPEFMNFIETGEFPNDDVLDQREKYHLIYFDKEKFEESSDQSYIKRYIEDNTITEFENVAGIKEIKGVVASKGKVSGPVRLVLSHKDSEDIKEGEILVAAMTTQEHIAGMRRAAAYVTDEGGMICHAAIVARELGTPCIVGTKIATRALKTGDMVEVDAESGVVKILQ